MHLSILGVQPKNTIQGTSKRRIVEDTDENGYTKQNSKIVFVILRMICQDGVGLSNFSLIVGE